MIPVAVGCHMPLREHISFSALPAMISGKLP